MTAPQTDATTDPQSIIAALQQRLDAATGREAALAEDSLRATLHWPSATASSASGSSIRPRPSTC